MKTYKEMTLEEFKQLIRPELRTLKWEEDKGGTKYGRAFDSNIEEPTLRRVALFFNVKDSDFHSNLAWFFPRVKCPNQKRAIELVDFINKSIELGFDPNEYIQNVYNYD